MRILKEVLQGDNAELQSKLSDFEAANNDMKNLLNSTEIATLFLNKEMNIRRFTDAVIKIFKIRVIDVGRPITELVSDLKYSEMGRDTKKVIKYFNPSQNTINTHYGNWFYMRVTPHRCGDDRIDGLIISFADSITTRKTKDAILIVNAYLRRIIEVNQFLIQMLRYSYQKIVKRQFGK